MWYYARNDQRYGPITADKMNELAAEGQINKGDLVWTKGMSQWTEAQYVQGLFCKQTPQSPPPLPAIHKTNESDTPLDFLTSMDVKDFSGSKARSACPTLTSRIIGRTIMPLCWLGVILFAVAAIWYAYSWDKARRIKSAIAIGGELWNKGEKGKAVEEYKQVLDILSAGSDASMLYQRVIDYELEKKDLVSARNIVHTAQSKGITVAQVGELETELNETKEPQIVDMITEDFLPYKSGMILYYDCEFMPWEQYGMKHKFERIRCTYKKDGVVEFVKVKEGIPNDDSVQWVKDLQKPKSGLGFLAENCRINNGFVEIGDTPSKETNDILWMPALKIGAKQGDTWEWTHPSLGAKMMKNRYRVNSFSTWNGLPSVTIINLSEQFVAISLPTVYRFTSQFAKGIGLVSHTVELGEMDSKGNYNSKMTIKTTLVLEESTFDGKKLVARKTIEDGAETISMPDIQQSPSKSVTFLHISASEGKSLLSDLILSWKSKLSDDGVFETLTGQRNYGTQTIIAEFTSCRGKLFQVKMGLGKLGAGKFSEAFGSAVACIAQPVTGWSECRKWIINAMEEVLPNGGNREVVYEGIKTTVVYENGYVLVIFTSEIPINEDNGMNLVAKNTIEDEVEINKVKPHDTQLIGKRDTPPVGRELKVIIGKAQSMLIAPYNSSLKSVKCYATSDELIIDLDLDDAPWQEMQTGWILALLVRLFDRNGNHLTHFTTTEGFTLDKDTYDMYKDGYNNAKSVGMSVDGYGHPIRKPTLLNRKGNRLTYSVNMRDLRDAAIVEIGFMEPGH